MATWPSPTPLVLAHLVSVLSVLGCLHIRGLVTPEGEAEGGHSHQGLATAQRGCGTPQECTFQVQSAAQSPRPKRPTPGHCPPPVTQGPVRRTDPQHWLAGEGGPGSAGAELRAGQGPPSEAIARCSS